MTGSDEERQEARHGPRLREETRAQQAERQDRKAQALRANLRKRKQQQRRRRDAEAESDAGDSDS